MFIDERDVICSYSIRCPSDVNWYEMRKDFDKFVNQLRFKAKNILEANSNDTTNKNINIGLNAPKKHESNCTIISYKRNKIQKLRNILLKIWKKIYSTLAMLK